MHSLYGISPLIKLVLIFGLIVTFIRLRLSLGTALIAGSVFLGLWFHFSLLQVAASVIDSLLASQTITLFAVVGLILVLSRSMEVTGQMKRLLESFQGISHNMRLNLALFPMLIGLLPMPGGAVFSAPMVQEIGDEKTMQAEHKTFINYWFRHIWEFSWPLYPGVILTCALSGIQLWKFILIQFPLTLFAALVGYLARLRSVPHEGHYDTTRPPKLPMKFVAELMPIVFVVVGALFFGALVYLAGNAVPLSTTTRKEAPLIVALIISILLVWKRNHMGAKEIGRALFDRSLFCMIFMIAGIMIFQGMLKDTGAASQISQDLGAAKVHLALVAVALPFLVGTITGVTVAFVGTTFPIILGLLATAGMTDQILAYTVLAYCAGYLGVLLSPLHACLILSCAYFHTDLARIYPRLCVSCLALAGAGLLSFWINGLF